MKTIKQYFANLSILSALMLLYIMGMTALIGVCFIFYNYSNLLLTVLTIISFILTVVYGYEYNYKIRKLINKIQLLLSLVLLVVLFIPTSNTLPNLIDIIYLLSVYYIFTVCIEKIISL